MCCCCVFVLLFTSVLSTDKPANRPRCLRTLRSNTPSRTAGKLAACRRSLSLCSPPVTTGCLVSSLSRSWLQGSPTSDEKIKISTWISHVNHARLWRKLLDLFRCQGFRHQIARLVVGWDVHEQHHPIPLCISDEVPTPWLQASGKEVRIFTAAGQMGGWREYPSAPSQGCLRRGMVAQHHPPTGAEQWCLGLGNGLSRALSSGSS